MVAQSDRTVAFRLRVEADPSAPAALRAFGESIASEGKRAVNDFAAVASRQIAELQRRVQSMARGPGAGGFAGGTASLPTARLVSVPLGPQPHPASPWPAQRPTATHIPTTVQRGSSPLFNQPALAQPGDLPEGKRVHRPLPFSEVENLSIVREAQKQKTEQDAIRSRGGRGPVTSLAGGKLSQQDRDLAKQNARDAADAERIRRDALGKTGRAYEDHIRKLERIRELEAKGKLSPGTAAAARREEIDRFTAPARRDAERQSARELVAQKREEQQQIRSQQQAEARRKQEEARAQREQNKRTIDILRQQDKEEGERQKAAEQEAKAREKAVRDNESARKKMVEANLRVGESLKAGLEGAMSMARGMAYMGLMGEESTEKILKGLVAIEGGIALVKGSITIVSSVAKTWLAVRDATAAATAAAKANAAMQALAGAAGVASGRAAAGGAAAAGAAGLAGGTGVAAAAGAAGLAGGTGVAAAAGGMLSGGGLALAGTAALVGTVGAGVVAYETVRDMNRYGLGGGYSPGSLGGRIAALTVPAFRGQLGMSMSGRVTEDQYRWRRMWKTHEANQRSVQQREMLVQRRDIEATGQLQQDQLQDEQQQRDVDEQYRRRGYRADQPLQYAQFRGEQHSARYARQEQERRIEEIDVRRPNSPVLAGRFAEERRAAVEELGRRSRTESSANQMAAYASEQMRLAGQQAAERERVARENATRLRREAARAEEAYREKSSSAGFSNPGEQERLYDAMANTRRRSEEASVREIAASQARLQVEREISNQKIGAAQASIEIGRREIESRTQAIENYRRQLTAGAESFGSLNRGEMSMAVNAMQAAREGRRLSDQQLGLLDRIQTEDAQRAASEQRQLRAYEHFGGGEEGRRRYEETFGQTERRGIERNEQAVQRLQVDVRQQELQVNIDRTRDTSLIQSISRNIYEAVRQHNEELVREVGREVDKKLKAAIGDVEQKDRISAWSLWN